MRQTSLKKSRMQKARDYATNLKNRILQRHQHATTNSASASSDGIDSVSVGGGVILQRPPRRLGSMAGEVTNGDRHGGAGGDGAGDSRYMRKTAKNSTVLPRPRRGRSQREGGVTGGGGRGASRDFDLDGRYDSGSISMDDDGGQSVHSNSHSILSQSVGSSHPGRVKVQKGGKSSKGGKGGWWTQTQSDQISLLLGYSYREADNTSAPGYISKGAQRANIIVLHTKLPQQSTICYTRV